jgi:hypothetical protein
MTRPNVQIGDDVRLMNDDEFAQWQKDAADAEAAAAAADDLARARASAIAKLAALGLTDDEINAVVG